MTAALLAAAVAISVAACGGTSSEGGSSSATGSTSGAGTSSTTAGSDTTGSDTTGSGAQASSQAGLKVFTDAGCGSCHTLAAAHASGDIGPDLDQLKPSESEVVTQVTDGGGAMPSFAGRLSKAQIEAVAKFVASAAG